MSVKSFQSVRLRGSFTTPFLTVRRPWSYEVDGSPVENGVTIDDTYSFMIDRYQKYGDGIWPYKPCLKYKSQVTGMERRFGITTAYCKHHPEWSVNRGMYTGNRIYPLVRQHSMNYEDLTKEVCPDTLIQRVWGRIEGGLPSLKNEAPDLIVFISEFLDIFNAFKFLKERTVALMAAGAHLSWEFGIKSMLRDIAYITASFITYQHRINGLLQGVGKLHDMKRGCDGEIVTEHRSDKCPFGYLDTGQAPGCGDYSCDRRVLRCGIAVKYVYKWPEFLFAHEQKVYEFLRGVGLLPDWSTVWEKIPFSFVLDWVFNTDRLFESLHLDKIGDDIKVDIIEICLSEKLTLTHEEKWSVPCIDYCIPAREETTVFRRTVGTDALNIIQGNDWWLRLPSVYAAFLGVSLAEVVGLRPRVRSVKPTKRRFHQKHKP